MDIFVLAIITQVADTIATTAPEPSGIWDPAILTLVTTLVSVLTFYVMKGVKWLGEFVSNKLPTWLAKVIHIDGFPAMAQRLVVVLIAAGLTWVSLNTGVELPTDIGQVGEANVSQVIMTLMSSLFAMAGHKIAKPS